MRNPDPVCGVESGKQRMDKPVLNIVKPMIEYWVGDSAGMQIPASKLSVKCKWQVDILVLESSGLVTEFEVSFDRKMKISELLDVMMNEVIGATCEAWGIVDRVNCGLRIY